MAVKGGKKRGGRVKGQRNRRTVERERAIHEAGVDPLTFLLDGMRFHYEALQAAVTRGPENRSLKAAKRFADEVSALWSKGREFAKDAAPYCHARLQAIEHKGADGGPIQVQRIERVIVDPKNPNSPGQGTPAPVREQPPSGPTSGT